MARAFAVSPRLLLLDESFGALDEQPAYRTIQEQLMALLTADSAHAA